MRQKLIFITLVLCAIGLHYVPILHLPFEWLETYFHEISHGLMAIMTGGRIDHIELSFDGSGLCYSAGGIRWLVTFSGYAGAVLWGYLLYISSTSLSARFSYILSWGIAILIGISALLWVRDLTSLMIISLVIGLFILSAKLRDFTLSQQILQLSAIYVMLSATRAPLFLLHASVDKNAGDGARLAQYTGLPELIWVLIWLGLAVTGLFMAWSYQTKNLVLKPTL